MSPSRSAKQVLAELEARLRRVKAPIVAGLRPGLSESETLQSFTNAGVNPDPGLVELYMWHNGAEGGGPLAELTDNARFVSLQEAIENRTFELGLATENEFLTDLPAAEIFDP